MATIGLLLNVLSLFVNIEQPTLSAYFGPILPKKMSKCAALRPGELAENDTTAADSMSRQVGVSHFSRQGARPLLPIWAGTRSVIETI